MREDPKIQKVQQGYQPRKNGAIKSLLGLGRRTSAMDGYQPTMNEVTKGYRPTQPVDMSNLRIPMNLGTAAVTPRNNSNSACASAEPKKKIEA